MFNDQKDMGSILLNSGEAIELEKKFSGINLYQLIHYSHLDGVNRDLNAIRSMMKSEKYEKDLEEFTGQEVATMFRLVLYMLSDRYNIDVKDISEAINPVLEKERKQAKPTVTGLVQGKPVFPPIYKFQLAPYGPGDWGVTIIRPFPPHFVPHYEIIPADLIEQLSRLPVDPETVIRGTVTITLDDDLDTPYRVLDLCVTRMSEIHIMGVVSEHLGQWREKLMGEETDWIKELESDPEAVDPLFTYMLYNDPEFSDAFIEAFVNEKLPELQK